MNKGDDEMGKKQEIGEVTAFLGKETEFEGKLNFKGAVRVDGRFKGEIMSNDVIIVGEGAKIEGDIIEVGIAVIQGEVLGNIKASQKVELRSTAKVRGDITTPVFIVEEGAVFDGYCKMREEESKVSFIGEKKEAPKSPSS